MPKPEKIKNFVPEEESKNQNSSAADLNETRLPSSEQGKDQSFEEWYSGILAASEEFRRKMEIERETAVEERRKTEKQKAEKREEERKARKKRIEELSLEESKKWKEKIKKTTDVSKAIDEINAKIQEVKEKLAKAKAAGSNEEIASLEEQLSLLEDKSEILRQEHGKEYEEEVEKYLEGFLDELRKTKAYQEAVDLMCEGIVLKYRGEEIFRNLQKTAGEEPTGADLKLIELILRLKNAGEFKVREASETIEDLKEKLAESRRKEFEEVLKKEEEEARKKAEFGSKSVTLKEILEKAMGKEAKADKKEERRRKEKIARNIRNLIPKLKTSKSGMGVLTTAREKDVSFLEGLLREENPLPKLEKAIKEGRFYINEIRDLLKGAPNLPKDLEVLKEISSAEDPESKLDEIYINTNRISPEGFRLFSKIIDKETKKEENENEKKERREASKEEVQKMARELAEMKERGEIDEEDYLETLKRMGIKPPAEVETGYFTNEEVKTALQKLEKNKSIALEDAARLEVILKEKLGKSSNPFEGLKKMRKTNEINEKDYKIIKKLLGKEKEED